MAQRDRSQGFGFVYMDFGKVPTEKSISESPKVNFNRDGFVSKRPTPPQPVQDPSQTVAIEKIKENLDRLQSLHHKLHAMLAELNQVSESDKKRKE